MRRLRPSLEHRKELLRRIEENQLLDARRRRLYNKKFRKSIFFITAWTIRIGYFLLFFIMSFYYDKPGGYHKEVIVDKSIEIYTYSSTRGNQKTVTLYFE